ncbi:DUF1801 domain-containing protein [Lysinibacter cavernae]|uniref:YdhG-like domain-containing protein n=1 Tax=Lysinibacter cavernae TaxID=1640652 RepID=A0A7X5QZT2_9MICO|nr:DUF1801 domain-containing protein [Lysinibacter cavernae]NIH52996.1 hypothetical protein [Lysinibacter cavernae]
MNANPDSVVEQVFTSYPVGIREPLLELRALIIEVAAATEGVGPLTETLKWGQPSYLTEQSKSGTTVRIDQFDEGHVAVLVNCQTTLIETARIAFPDLTYSKSRAIVLPTSDELPRDELGLFIAMALTYKLRK